MSMQCSPLFLVIVPLTILGNWQRELAEWTTLDFVTYHGSACDRDTFKQREFSRPGLIPRFDVLLTTLQMLQRETYLFQKLQFDCVVVDEGHSLKNIDSVAFQRVLALKTSMRVLLTGTPVQNNSAELFALLHMVEPDKFPSLAQFTSRFGLLEKAEEVGRFHKELKTFLLRRCKEDVETSIPAKEETVIDVELTFVQKQYYKAILEKNVAFLRNGSRKRASAPQLLNIGMELRKLCNHPFLVKGARDKLEREAEAAAANNSDAGTIATNKTATDDHELQALVKNSAKFVLLDKLLPKLRKDGRKVLIFTQMVKLLQLLEEYLEARQFPYECLHGATGANDREAAIQRFCNTANSFVFCLSTRAGGLGINLIAADTVIIFDSDWNPQNDLQAQARCHRIGQTAQVKIYRLVSSNTYEMQLFQCASRKLGLDRVLRHHDQKSAAGPGDVNNKIDAVEVEQMLRYGTVGVLEGGDDEQAAKSAQFLESDIDQILENSSRVVRYEGILGEAKSNVFAKASFVSEEGSVSLHDPEFWSQLLPTKEAHAVKIRRSLDELGTDDPAMVKKMFGNVEALAKPVVEARSNGDRPDETDEVLRLLNASIEHVAFSTEEKSQLKSWIQQIERVCGFLSSIYLV
eukprot:SAG31_NODE_840_length_11596_cov_3.056623_9_plen_633_part_01